jgi:PAS domain S-box-containing protein
MTERRRMAEEALRESEERFSLALDAANGGLWDFNPQTGEAYYNARWYTMLGYDPGELPSAYSTWADLLHPDDRSYAETRVKDFLKNRGDVYSIEFRMRAKNGDWRWIYSSGKAFAQDSEGNVIRIIGIHIDITEHKLAEEKRETILEAALDGFCTVSLKGRLLEVSDSCCDILGYSREELLKMSVQDIEDTESYNEITRHIKRLVKQGSARFETRLKCKDGSMIDAEVGVNDFDENEGQVFVLFRNITERKRLEKQMVNAQRMEAMGTLAGGIAHDFNNILMGIMGNTSLMLSDASFSHPGYARLKSIEQSVKSGAELTKKLLGFAGRGKYVVKPIDLNELIRSETRMFGHTKEEITIHETYEKNLWTVEADQDQIRQALLSLYVNAWQAMPSGGDIFTQTENLYLDEEYAMALNIDPGRYVKISVKDTGVGMDQSTQQRIFEPFFTTKEMERGIGLGLASAYGIIKNHGGAINVYSKKGEGATFGIYLPASEKKAVREEKAVGEVSKGEETILLVDDEEMIIDIGEKILKKLGYNVMAARCGEEAIGLYKKHQDKIDMVVLDMVMPFMDGGETYDRLKRINPNIKALLSSGYSVNGQAREILERGCNGFIQKPFNMWELSQAIRRILDR